MVRYTKLRDDRPIRSQVILGKLEGGGVHQPLPVPARVNTAGSKPDTCQRAAKGEEKAHLAAQINPREKASN